MDKRMTAKEYLEQAHRLDQRINAKLEQIMQLRSLSQRCTVAFGGEHVSHTRNVSSMEDVVIKIVIAEKKLDEQIDRFVALKDEIQQTIQLLPDAESQAVLELRYLAMNGWTDIAGKLNLSRSHVHRIHTEALAKIDRILETRSAVSNEYHD